MKIEKNKIVFGSVLVIVIIFIVAYSTLVLMGEEEPTGDLDQPSVPVLKEEKEFYTSKLKALDDIKEDRKSNPPSVYSEKFLDSLGVYDPLLEEKERERVVDSIYLEESLSYEETSWGADNYQQEQIEDENSVVEIPTLNVYSSQDFSVEYKEFFGPTNTSVPPRERQQLENTFFSARVNGNQQVRVNDRLELILMEDAIINGNLFPKKTLLYGFVSFKPNRVHIKISHINNLEVNLKAFDLQDSNEGIYVENSFRAEATKEVVSDVIQDINIAGLPQIGGIKNIFTRRNRNIKVTVLDQYQLILKP
ncbi:MAG TPA: conjugative transposon protein TraM [Salinimicrobium sp.]|nr:conjugative transposon protein TraM [Salinimicrobium sp.]